MAEGVPLRLEDVSKEYGAVQALKPLTLDVRAGEMLALLGPSGCGKTTTLRIIAGFETPTTGRVAIGGRDVTDLPPNRRGLGMVFQNYSLFPHMSVGENVAFGLKMRRVPTAERGRRVRAMLGLVRLDGYEDREVRQLSGGQQQRVALARSLVTDPAILLLDEPLGALDKSLRERMQFELREIQRRLGITSILVTHDQEEALTMSDRVAVMAVGEIVQLGPPTEVYERPRTRYVSEFLGTANIFAATVLGPAGPGIWELALALPAAPRVRIAAPDLAAGAAPRLAEGAGPRLAEGAAIRIAVRPERVEIGPPAPGTVPARVHDVVFRGSYFVYELLADGQDEPIFAYRQNRVPVPADGRVGFSWEPEAAIHLTDET